MLKLESDPPLPPGATWTQHRPNLVSSWLFPCLGRGSSVWRLGPSWGSKLLKAGGQGGGSTLDQSCLKPREVKGLQERPVGHLLEADSCPVGAAEWVSRLYPLPVVQQPTPPFLSRLAFTPVATGPISPSFKLYIGPLDAQAPPPTLQPPRKPACA